MTRRALGGWLILALCLGFLGAWSFTPDKPDHVETAVVPPPTHVEWDMYEVGGLYLAHPIDSARVQLLPLPLGARLFIPRLVQGVTPDDGKGS